MEAKDYIKPPFATYDIVVYFGCALFSLPLIFHYVLEPFSLRFPRFQFHIDGAFAESATSTLSILFTVYILGHLIAFAASHVIEKTVDSYFGKISSSIIISKYYKKENFSEVVQAWIFKRFKASFRAGRRISSAARLFLLFPVWPVMLYMFLFRQLDYFRSRIPPKILGIAAAKSALMGFGQINLRSQWYKALEHYVMNNHVGPSHRMYNYLVISGVFRSVSFLMLCCAWAELVFRTLERLGLAISVKALLSDHGFPYSHLVALSAFNIVFGFSLAAYLKFSRRYVEEVIFSFALSKE